MKKTESEYEVHPKRSDVTKFEYEVHPKGSDVGLSVEIDYLPEGTFSIAVL